MFLSYFIRQLAYDTYAVSEDDLDEYAQRMSAPGALRAGFEHYRAFPVDARRNQEHALTRLPMPVLAIGGDHCMGDQVGQIMRALADDVRTAVVERSGHWIPDEQPGQLAALLSGFFTQTEQDA